MKALVTGSSGHLGEALVRAFRERGDDVVGLDLLPSPFTDAVGSIVDRGFVDRHVAGCDVVFHAATLHKPHVATHRRQDFVDTNVTGTLNLLEAAAAAKAKRFLFTSTTSVFGDAMRPGAGREAVWVTEDLAPRAKNIYGATKAAAEDLCRIFHRNLGLPCAILRTSRFFPEADDNAVTRRTFADANTKVNEFLYRRADVEDVVSAHLLAAAGKPPGRECPTYIISATTPFQPEDAAALGHDVAGVLRQRVPAWEAAYGRLGWTLPASLGRVYDNARARRELGWQPRGDFLHVLRRFETTGRWNGPVAQAIGSKGYHAKTFEEGPFPVDPDHA